MNGRIEKKEVEKRREKVSLRIMWWEEKRWKKDKIEEESSEEGRKWKRKEKNNRYKWKRERKNGKYNNKKKELIKIRKNKVE